MKKSRFCYQNILMVLTLVCLLYYNISDEYYFALKINSCQNVSLTNESSIETIKFKNIPQHKPIKLFRPKLCSKQYGKIAIVTMFTAGDYTKVVANALISVQCYSKMRGYDLYQIEHDGTSVTSGLTNLTIVDKCRTKLIMAMRHCIIAYILPNYNYIVHLDADSGVINPDHCFEEYITPGIDIFFLERVHSGEIQSGHYIVKKTEYAKHFLLDWFNQMNAGGQYDNVVLIKVFAKLVLNQEDSQKCLLQSGWKLMLCIKKSLVGKRILDRVKIYRRAHAFARDAWTTDFMWSDQDFLLHALKHKDDQMFSRKLHVSDCDSNFWFSPIKENLYVNISTMKKKWAAVDESSFQKLAIDEKDISICWPDCPDNF